MAQICRDWRNRLKRVPALWLLTVLILLAACSGGADPTTTEPAGSSAEEELLNEYASLQSTGEIGPLMRLFWPDPEVRRHPFAVNDYMDRTSALRSTEEGVPAIQGSGTGLEFFEIEVSDGSSSFAPDVTFSWRFFYGSDGSESGGESGCIGGKNGKAFVSAGMFTAFDWGFADRSKCDT